jgi:hypothetical protein
MMEEGDTFSSVLPQRIAIVQSLFLPDDSMSIGNVGLLFDKVNTQSFKNFTDEHPSRYLDSPTRRCFYPKG